MSKNKPTKDNKDPKQQKSEELHNLLVEKSSDIKSHYERNKLLEKENQTLRESTVMVANVATGGISFIGIIAIIAILL